MYYIKLFKSVLSSAVHFVITGDRVVNRWKFVKKLWLIELLCDCPESVRPAWLTPSIHPPSSPSSPSTSLLPCSLFHHSWPALSAVPLRTKTTTPIPAGEILLGQMR
ncbi:hypothetical protein PAMP_006145 [Pampus punctatissimus]